MVYYAMIGQLPLLMWSERSWLVFLSSLLMVYIGLVACQEILPVAIKISPYQVHYGRTYVTTSDTLVVAAEVDDEFIINNQSKITYKWSTRDGEIITDPGSFVLNYKFNKPADDQFLKVEVSCHDGTIQRSGSSQFNLVVKDRVYVDNLVGKLFLEHGELLSVKIVYLGSPPITYCYKFCYDKSFIPCDLCFPSYTTDKKELQISPKYLHNIGNYTLMVSLSNVVSQEIKHYRIRIDETTREQKLPFAPIISSILAVLILLTGVTLHLHFRKTTYTETADFDFIRQAHEEEEWEEEQSFIQRVKYLFCRGETDDYYYERQRLIRQDSTYNNGSNKRNNVISYLK